MQCEVSGGQQAALIWWSSPGLFLTMGLGKGAERRKVSAMSENSRTGSELTMPDLDLNSFK